MYFYVSLYLCLGMEKGDISGNRGKNGHFQQNMPDLL
jgi:hypothetical protein